MAQRRRRMPVDIHSWLRRRRRPRTRARLADRPPVPSPRSTQRRHELWFGDGRAELWQRLLERPPAASRRAWSRRRTPGCRLGWSSISQASPPTEVKSAHARGHCSQDLWVPPGASARRTSATRAHEVGSAVLKRRLNLRMAHELPSPQSAQPLGAALGPHDDIGSKAGRVVARAYDPAADLLRRPRRRPNAPVRHARLGSVRPKLARPTWLSHDERPGTAAGTRAAFSMSRKLQAGSGGAVSRVRHAA